MGRRPKYPDVYKLEAQKLWIKGLSKPKMKKELQRRFPKHPVPSERTIGAWVHDWRETEMGLAQARGKAGYVVQKKGEVIALQTEILADVNEQLIDFQAKMRQYILIAERWIQEDDEDNKHNWEGLKILKDINTSMYKEFRETKSLIARISGVEAPQKNINLNVNVDVETLKDKLARYEEEGLFDEE